jgi:hypothetical protein
VRKVLKGIILCVLILSLMIPASIVSAASKITVVLDGDSMKFDVQPFIDSSSRTMVPIRMISEEMGALVDWNSSTNVVTIKQDKKTILLKIGESKATVNGKTIKLDTKAIAKNGRTFVPLRFVSEALGASVSWDGRYRIVYINTKERLEAKNDLERMIRSLDSFTGTTYYDDIYGTIAINLKGTDKFEDTTISVFEDKDEGHLYLTFYNFGEGERNLLKEVLEKYYPTSHKKVYEVIQSGKRVETKYDSIYFNTYVGYTGDIIVIIGLGN